MSGIRMLEIGLLVITAIMATGATVVFYFAVKFASDVSKRFDANTKEYAEAITGISHPWWIKPPEEPPARTEIDEKPEKIDLNHLSDEEFIGAIR